MSAKTLDDWGEDEDEEDFIPGDYDDEGDDYVDDEDEEDDPEEFPVVPSKAFKIALCFGTIYLHTVCYMN